MNQLMWETGFEVTLASGDGDKTGTVHILIFRDPIEVDTWDVANCGQSLGNWEAWDLVREGLIQSTVLCKTCFVNGLGA